MILSSNSLEHRQDVDLIYLGETVEYFYWSWETRLKNAGLFLEFEPLLNIEKVL